MGALGTIDTHTLELWGSCGQLTRGAVTLRLNHVAVVLRAWAGLSNSAVAI